MQLQPLWTARVISWNCNLDYDWLKRCMPSFHFFGPIVVRKKELEVLMSLVRARQEDRLSDDERLSTKRSKVSVSILPGFDQAVTTFRTTKYALPCVSYVVVFFF